MKQPEEKLPESEIEEFSQQPPLDAAQEQDAREMGFLPEKERQICQT